MLVPTHPQFQMATMVPAQLLSAGHDGTESLFCMVCLLHQPATPHHSRQSRLHLVGALELHPHLGHPQRLHISLIVDSEKVLEYQRIYLEVSWIHCVPFQHLY